MVSYIQCLILIHVITGIYPQNDTSFDIATNTLQWTYESQNSSCDYFKVKRFVFSSELTNAENDVINVKYVTFDAQKYRYQTKVNWTHYPSTTYRIIIQTCINESGTSRTYCNIPNENEYYTNPHKPLVYLPTLEKCENTSCYIKISRIVNASNNITIFIDVINKTGIKTEEGYVSNIFNCDREFLKNKTSLWIDRNMNLDSNSFDNISLNIGNIRSRIQANEINKLPKNIFCDYKINIIAVNYYREKMKCSDSKLVMQTCDTASSDRTDSAYFSFFIGISIALLFVVIATVIAIYAIRARYCSNEDSLDKNKLECLPLTGDAVDLKVQYWDQIDPETSRIGKLLTKTELYRILSMCKHSDISHTIQEEYNLIPVRTKQQTYGAQYTRHNRYSNILPYEWNRVRLENVDENSDYINASYILSASGEKRYIATQNPLTETVPDFWKMIWQENTNLIVMLTDFVENGKILGNEYWQERGTTTYDQLEIHHLDTKKYVGHTQRTLQIKKRNKSRNITHLHFTSWLDKEIPITCHSFHRFLKLVQQNNSSGPIVVHCSSGVGRSGAFILCNYILDSFAVHSIIDFPGSLYNLRRCRPYMIQESLQYKFCHCAVNEYLHETALEIDVNHFKNTYHIYSDSSSLNQLLDYVNNGIFWVDVLKLASARGTKETIFRGLYSQHNLVSIPDYHNSINFVCLVQPTLRMTEDFWEIVSSKNANIIVSMHSDLNSFEFGLSLERELPICADKDVILQSSEDRGTYKISKIMIKTKSNNTHKQMTLIQYRTKDKNLFAEPKNFLTFLNNFYDLKRATLVRNSLMNVVLAYANSFDECVMFLIIQRIVDIITNEDTIDISGAIKSVQMFKDFNVSLTDLMYICDFLHCLLLHNQEIL